MKQAELTASLLDFLNENGMYIDYLEWAEDNGEDRDQLEDYIENLPQ